MFNRSWSQCTTGLTTWMKSLNYQGIKYSYWSVYKCKYLLFVYPYCQWWSRDVWKQGERCGQLCAVRLGREGHSSFTGVNAGSRWRLDLLPILDVPLLPASVQRLRHTWTAVNGKKSDCSALWFTLNLAAMLVHLNADVSVTLHEVEEIMEGSDDVMALLTQRGTLSPCSGWWRMNSSNFVHFLSPHTFLYCSYAHALYCISPYGKWNISQISVLQITNN